MKYEKSLDIIMAAVQAETGYDADQLKLIRGGIINGFLRVERLEAEEKRAVDTYSYFQVGKVQEGFALWYAGGYDKDRNAGNAVIAAGADGGKLRKVSHMKERNGRHCLAVVYPGCYIATATANNLLECDNLSVYQIVSFIARENAYLAKCVRMYRERPHMSRLSVEEEDRLSGLMNLANRIAITPNIYNLRDWV